MQIKNVEDLFRLYDFEGDLRLKIKQYLNVDTYLLKMGKMSIVYKIFKDKIKIIEIHIF
ncbi:hypothetical protein ACPDI4_001025 [Campylobacter upsaliensis]